MCFSDMNTSVQIGDIVYYSSNPTVYGAHFTPGDGPIYDPHDTVTINDTTKLGIIVSMNGNCLTVEYDDAFVSPPASDAFILFAKSKQLNTTSLKGYYAKVKFVNNSSDHAEIFSVGSDIGLSSK